MGRVSSGRALPAFLCLYALVSLSLLTRLSLWLDEIVDLRQIRDSGLAGLLAQVPLNAGGVPLNYLARAASIHVLGYSVLSARLPSLIFSIIAAWGVYFLAQQVNLRFPLLAVAIFCAFPMQFRYALESRPYSQALATAVWTTDAFLSLRSRPTIPKASLYALLVLAGLYTQPYTVFVPVAHLLWSLRDRQLWPFIAGSIAAASLAFLPWHLWALHLWSASAAAHGDHSIRAGAALLILKELVGAGYFGTLFTLLLAFFAMKRNGLRYRQLWIVMAGCSLTLPVLADAIFGYFLAARQLITILIPLALLSAAGLEQLWIRNSRLTTLLAVAFMLLLLGATVQFFRRPRENWRSASNQLENVVKRNGCIMFEPSDSERLYSFFAPDLSRHICPDKLMPTRQPIALAKSPYGPSPDYALKRQQLRVSGYRQIKELNGREPRIYLFAPSQ